MRRVSEYLINHWFILLSVIIGFIFYIDTGGCLTKVSVMLRSEACEWYKAPSYVIAFSKVLYKTSHPLTPTSTRHWEVELLCKTQTCSPGEYLDFSFLF